MRVSKCDNCGKDNTPEWAVNCWNRRNREFKYSFFFCDKCLIKLVLEPTHEEKK